MNATSKITAKKQVTLPNYVMEALNLKPSDKVEFLLDDSSEEAPVVKVKKIKNFLELEGTIKSKYKYDDRGASEKIKKYISESYKP